MAKNPRRKQNEVSPALSQMNSAKDRVSKRGKKVIAAGIGTVIVGFWILTYTDPAGQNWASTLSPALLVLGYAAIGVGLILPDGVSDATPPAQ